MRSRIDGVYHLYFGDASRHPIVGNYMRSLPSVRQEILLTSIPDGKLARLAWLIRHLFERRHETTWVLHCHDVVSAVFGTILWRGRVIYDSHEIYESLAGRGMAKLVARMERFAQRRADIVVFPSEYRAGYYDVQRGKVRIVENLFYPYQKRGGDNTSQVTLAEGSEIRPLRFVYTGLFTPARAIDAIVQAFADPKLANCELVLAGRETAYLDDIIANASPNVQYIGELQHDEVVELLATADAGFALYRPINENNRRCAPTKIFEFLYFGVHVVANRSPYIEDIERRVDEGFLTCINEISSAEIIAACLKVGRRSATVSTAMQDVVSWEAQLPILTELYS